MGINRLQQLILATVALLLDPTFADVLVQPGYSQPKEPQRTNYVGNSNPWLQNIQQQHQLEQQHLQQLHLREHNDLLQLQQEQLRYHQNQPQGNQDFTGSSQSPIVGTAWGLPSHHLGSHGFGGLGGAGTRLFSLGPLGLNSFRLGGLGAGFMPPLLLSTQQQQSQTEASGQSEPTSSVSRKRRDVRPENSGNVSGRRYGPKASRAQQNGMAQNPTLKSQSDIAPQTPQSIKGNDDIVGDTGKNDQEETVGSSLLDPLGLKDKVEDLMEGLGNFPNPLDALRGDGRHPGHSHYLGKADSGTKTSQVPQIEEHIVSQSQQYHNQYPNQYQDGVNDFTLTSQNQPQINPQQQYQQQQYQQQQIVGGYRESQTQQRPIVQPQSTIQPQNPPPSLPARPMYGTSIPQPPFGPAWTGRSNPMAYQRNSMPYNYQGYSTSGYPNSYPSMNGQMTGAKSPIVGAPNPMIQSLNPNGPSKDQQTQSARESNQPILGSPSPVSAGQEQIVGAPNLASGFYPGGQSLSAFSDVLRAAQPMIGPLIQDAMTGSSGPFGYQNNNANNPMTGLFNGADRYGRYGGYNGGSPRHLGFGDLYDNGFNNLFDGGYNDRNYYNDGYYNNDRFYGDGQFGYGGDYPGYGGHGHHHHHQYSQIYK